MFVPVSKSVNTFVSANVEYIIKIYNEEKFSKFAIIVSFSRDKNDYLTLKTVRAISKEDAQSDKYSDLQELSFQVPQHDTDGYVAGYEDWNKFSKDLDDPAFWDRTPLTSSDVDLMVEKEMNYLQGFKNTKKIPEEDTTEVAQANTRGRILKFMGKCGRTYAKKTERTQEEIFYPILDLLKDVPARNSEVHKKITTNFSCIKRIEASCSSLLSIGVDYLPSHKKHLIKVIQSIYFENYGEAIVFPIMDNNDQASLAVYANEGETVLSIPLKYRTDAREETYFFHLEKQEKGKGFLVEIPRRDPKKFNKSPFMLERVDSRHNNIIDKGKWSWIEKDNVRYKKAIKPIKTSFLPLESAEELLNVQTEVLLEYINNSLKKGNEDNENEIKNCANQKEKIKAACQSSPFFKKVEKALRKLEKN